MCMELRHEMLRFVALRWGPRATVGWSGLMPDAVQLRRLRGNITCSWIRGPLLGLMEKNIPSTLARPNLGHGADTAHRAGSQVTPTP